MNKKAKTIITLASTAFLLIVVMSLLAVYRFNMVSLHKTDITIYINDLPVSDVYRLSDSDLYFFIVWAGKRQEGYYVNFDKQIVSMSMQPFSSKIDDDKIKVGGVIKADYNFIYDLQTLCDKTDNVITFDVGDVVSPEVFKTRPLILQRKLIFMFNKELATK